MAVMRVLIACEFSGVVRDAFIQAGHKAMSCDFLPTESPGHPHYQGDVHDILDVGWDLMVAHPPCTYLTNSGVRWLHEDDDVGPPPKGQPRWEAMREGAEFFRSLLEAPIPRVAVENPIMHKYAKEIVGRGADQFVQPWQFGDPYSKRTGLWLRGLDPLEPTDVIEMDRYLNQTASGQNKLGPSEDRWKLRSITYPGLAAAMVDQWG